MRFDVLTLFPEVFRGYLDQSLVKRAQDRGLVRIERWNIRDWSKDKHQAVDDRPYGGGPGMVLMPQPIFDCVEEVTAKASPAGQLVMLTPQGRRLEQSLVEQLAGQERLLLLCGRYEGFDERIRVGLKPLELSIGDYVLGGGELAAMVVIDTVIRLVPGVLGDEQSAKEDSFSEARVLEYPQYTRPREFRGMRVPDVLLGGNHEQIARWRRRQAMVRTRERRGDADNRHDSRDDW
jgi:tRNA (guanine37-N1)-methyltransferase